MLRRSVSSFPPAAELESKLRLSERWFEIALRSIGDAVIATDVHGAVTFMNQVAEALTGYFGDDALGSNIDDVLRLVSPTGKHVDNPLWTALATKAHVQLPVNTSLVDRNGSSFFIEDSISSIVDDDSEIVGAVIVFRDVTERRKLEQRLAQTERLASIGMMVAGVGHEINNPLSYVIANVAFSVEELKKVLDELRASGRGPADGPTVQWSIERLESISLALRDASVGNEKMRALVDDLRPFSRSDTASTELFDLPDVIETAIKMTASTIRHHARLRKEYGTTPFVEGRPGQLTQVLTNLIVNAAQAIGEGRAELNEIRIRTMVDASGRAVIEVHDSGPGIPAEVLPNIFDAFFTTKPVGDGTGLGLAICHNVIASWGGEITVESALGNGSTFRVALPPARSSGIHKKVAERPSQPPSRLGKVLVVDDERAIGEAIVRMLGSEHDVVVETDASRALVRISRGEIYDVIFCDLMMPNLSGMDFHQSLMSSAPETARRIVFMTGGAFSERSRAFLEDVVNVSVEKPFRLNSIRTIANDYVNRAARDSRMDACG
ncbi:MAG: ATP-binding protein [Polyangiaceae bacterium]